MKPFKTALLASVFALDTTMAFAQVGVGTSSGAAAGTGTAGTSGSTHLNANTGANAKVGGRRAHASVDASGNTIMKKSSTTTGSGGAGASVNGTLK
jgi:hypothetical protein